MLELSGEICSLFNADRLTIYSVGEDKASIVSKVKTGLNSFKDLRLPIADQSIAGYVALAKKTVNIRDVYDDGELKAINPSLRFLQEVDKRTGYRTKQMLVAPVVDAQNGELLGVVQIINNKAGTPFAAVAQEGVKGLVRDPRNRLQPAQQAGGGRQDQVRFPGVRRRHFRAGARTRNTHRATQEPRRRRSPGQ
jgi:hypothetical protein